MTEDAISKHIDDPLPASSTSGKQRKRRKWDQPAESLISATAAGIQPGIPLPNLTSYPAAPLTNLLPVTSALPSHTASSSPSLHPAAVVAHKLNQAKIQDELIAREININDAAPSVRFRLTKRQTLEEIERNTGSIIIIRGKYHPPDTPANNEKPLYLHISAGTHLKDTAERIKAVDHAASMVEEVLKQGQNLHPPSAFIGSAQKISQVTESFGTCVYLGFETAPDCNISARIRGPNDQYINHIINETGASVVLRGRYSENDDSCHTEGEQQPLHLYISSMHAKSVEAARILAEHLLDTIAVECGATRNSSSKLYSAIPPPQQLMTGSMNSITATDAQSSLAAGVTSVSGPTVGMLSLPHAGTSVSAGFTAFPPVVALPSAVPSYSAVPPIGIGDITPQISGRTCYNGYDGIYPRATPLQQVALALKQAPSTFSSVLPSSNTLSETSETNIAHLEEKRMPQKRKFQELPISMGTTAKTKNSQQGSEFVKSGLEDPRSAGYVHIPAVKISHCDTDGRSPPLQQNMPPPPPRNMMPPPPKFSSHSTSVRAEPRKTSSDASQISKMSLSTDDESSRATPKKDAAVGRSSADPISDTLLSLADYGDDDDDDDADEEPAANQINAVQSLTAKPFWAV